MTIPTPTEEEKYRLLEMTCGAIQDGIVILDANLNIIMANRWMELKYPSKAPLDGKKCYSVFRNAQQSCPNCPYVKSYETGEPHTEVVEYLSDEGVPEWVELSTYRLEDVGGAVIGAIGHVKDITERKRAEDALKDEIQRRRMMVEQSRDGIVVLEQDGSVYEANQEYARMLGYSLEEVQQLHIWDWDTQFMKDELLGMLEAVDSSGDHFETHHRRKDGTLLEVEISTNGTVCGGKKLIFCVCRDITEKKAMEKRIHDLAIRDPLTEAYNRRYIFGRLAEISAEYSRGGRNFCVSILDIDHFKVVNDTMGHLAGDFALKEFASTIASITRHYDLLGRYGGEEFIIVSTSARAPETAAMIERLLRTVREKAFVFDGQEIRFTVSAGLADSSEFSRDGFSVEAMVSLADKRLYDAKRRGRDCCVPPSVQPQDNSETLEG